MKVGKKEVVIISVEQIINGTNNFLKNYCFPDGVNPDITDVWELFPDPDYIKVNGEIGRGNIPFGKHEVKTKIYIIVDEALEQNEIDILYWWLGGAANEIELPNSRWEDWNTVKEGVAYRGGAGYSYNLYAKSLIN